MPADQQDNRSEKDDEAKLNDNREFEEISVYRVLGWAHSGIDIQVGS